MIRFGTGGWRAVIGEEFTFANVRLLAKALSCKIKMKTPLKPVLVGHDLRFLSGRFSRAFAEVLAGEGIPVLFIHRAVPTPMLMHGVEEEGLDYGIMITASHNPSEYNGVKVIVEKGKDAPVEVTDSLEEILAHLTSAASPFEGQFYELLEKGCIRYYTNKNGYIDSLLAQIDVQAIQKVDLRILFNPMFGVAKDLMAMVLASLRCFVDLMNDRRDSSFGSKVPSPERESLQDMEYLMKERRYDLGIATDGDSDRLALYDELGEYIGPNQILKLLFYYFKEYRKQTGGVVRNLTTTHILDKMAAYYGEASYEVPVGFKHISSAMEEYDLLLGGESSGGLKVRGHVNGKDGILAALLIVEMLAKTKKTLSTLLNEIDARFGTMEFYFINLPFLATRKEALTSLLMEKQYVPKLPKTIEKVSALDGIKYYFTDGTWLCFRFSGTEPLLRIFMEMNAKEECAVFLKLLLEDPVLSIIGKVKDESSLLVSS